MSIALAMKVQELEQKLQALEKQFDAMKDMVLDMATKPERPILTLKKRGNERP